MGIYVNQHNLGTFKKISTISFQTNIARGTGDKDDQPLYLTLANTIDRPPLPAVFSSVQPLAEIPLRPGYN